MVGERLGGPFGSGLEFCAKVSQFWPTDPNSVRMYHSCARWPLILCECITVLAPGDVNIDGLPREFAFRVVTHKNIKSLIRCECIAVLALFRVKMLRHCATLVAFVR